MDGSESVLEFRLERKSMFIFVFGVIFSSFIGCLGFLAAYMKPQGPDFLMKLCFGGVFSVLALLFLYLLDLYRTYRLYLGAKTIRQIGVFTKQSISIPLITELRWGNRHGGGSIRIISSSGTLSIGMPEFSRRDRTAIMQFLRANVNERLQTNFERFRYAYLLDPALVAEREIKSTKALKKYYKTYFYIFLFHVVAFGAFGIAGRGAEFFYYAALNAGACVWLRWKERKQLQAEVKENIQQE